MTEKTNNPENNHSSGVWKVLIPVSIVVLLLLAFSFKIIFKKKEGKRLSENKSLDKLDYVKNMPSHVDHTDPDLIDLSEEEREYIQAVLEKTQTVHSNF